LSDSLSCPCCCSVKAEIQMANDELKAIRKARLKAMLEAEHAM
jgi:hypothetical protein